MWQWNWSSPAFLIEGIMVVPTVGAVMGPGGAAVGEGWGVITLGAGGLLTSVSGVCMMKRTVGAGGVFLGALGRGVSKSVAVCELYITVSQRCFLDLELF